MYFEELKFENGLKSHEEYMAITGNHSYIDYLQYRKNWLETNERRMRWEAYKKSFEVHDTKIAKDARMDARDERVKKVRTTTKHTMRWESIDCLHGSSMTAIYEAYTEYTTSKEW